MSIYPKLAAARPAGIIEGSCFLLMPFSKELRPVHATIKEVCEALKIKCERADDIYSQRPIFSTILEGILVSEVIIADLTGKNANVFYETGIAHSLREPQSVILISQSLDDVPFDLRHLPIVLYKLENMQRFEVELEHRVVHSRTATLGVNFASSYLFPLHFAAHDVKSFIDYSNELSPTFFLHIARVLRPSDALAESGVTAANVQDILKTLTLVREASNGRWKRICDFLKLEILCTERIFSLTQEKCTACLQQTSVSQYEIRDRDDDMFAVELCFKLIERDLIRTKAINWLLEYLHNPRMGNIDVVRYKIETFIVERVDPDIDKSLLALLSTNSPAVRENVADMVGQKRIAGAERYLTNALAIEDNPYTARSIITALARQNAEESVGTIVDWIERHRANWWEEPISVTLQKVSFDTVKKLDVRGADLSRLQEILSAGNGEKSE